MSSMRRPPVAEIILKVIGNGANQYSKPCPQCSAGDQAIRLDQLMNTTPTISETLATV